MTYSIKTLNKSASSRREPSGLARFTQEIGLTLGVVGLLFWCLALYSYTRTDPAWSTSGTGEPMRNWAGHVGALLADGSYVLFGFSVWWCVVVAARAWWLAFMRWSRVESGSVHDDEGPWWQRLDQRRIEFWLGLCLLLSASAALEWMRLYRWDGALPAHAGGVWGRWLGGAALRWLGDTGSALVVMCALVIGQGWVFRFSWMALAEGIGQRLATLIDGWRGRWTAHQDHRIGQRAVREREHITHPQATVPKRTRQTAAKEEAVAASPTPLTPEEEALQARRQRRENLLRRAKTVVGLDKGELMPEQEPEPAAPVASASAAPSGPKRAPKPKVTDAGSQTALTDSALPQVDLLDGIGPQQSTVSADTLEMTSRLIEKRLRDFGVQVTVVAAFPGPVITRYEIEPATGVKGSQVVNLAKDLARSLSLVSIRVIETIPGKNLMALELPNARRQTIKLSEILGSPVYHDARSLLTMGLGKDIAGQPVVADLAKMPHCLVAGTTGSGKSVGINAMILSLLYKAEPKDVRLLMIDPKMLELSVYEGIPHLLCPVVTDMKQAANGLSWCVGEMEKRYKLMSKVGVRNLAGYNTKIDEAKARGESIANPFSLTPEQPEPLERLPHIVVVIDELADLMMVVGKKIEELIARLAQKARAAGIHLILATQRPSVDVITGLIKANIPTRISFQVSSKIDSRTILDQMGAEALLGMGDMLYMPSGSGYPTRVHGAFVSDEEVHRVVTYLKAKGGEPDYIEGVLDGGTDGEGGDLFGNDGGEGAGEKDPLYDQAVAIVLKDRKASISYVQRKLQIGYNRSARLLEHMEKAGLVSSLTASGQREILVAARGGE
ncbi:MAG: DNA translocase FtsK [Macromonas sp.]